MRRFDELLILVCTYFNNEKIPYTIIGGVAVLFQGRFRTTEDIDLVVLHKNIDIEDFVFYCKQNELSIENYELTNGFKARSHISIFDLPSGLRIDLRGVYTEWDEGVVDSAEEYEYEGKILKIAKPEYLIANKLFKGGSLDIEDAFSVYVQNQNRINLELLKRISDLLGVGESLQKLLSDVRNVENTV